MKSFVIHGLLIIGFCGVAAEKVFAEDNYSGVCDVAPVPPPLPLTFRDAVMVVFASDAEEPLMSEADRIQFLRAEYSRRASEMNLLSTKNRFAGFEPHFARLLAARAELASLGQPLELGADVWQWAAEAAYQLGDFDAALERFQAASSAGTLYKPVSAPIMRQLSERARTQVDFMQKNSGRIPEEYSTETQAQRLSRENYLQRKQAARAAGSNCVYTEAPPVRIEALEVPFDPAQVRAIEFANSKYLETGRFPNHVPVGRYRKVAADGTILGEFSVQPQLASP